MVCPICLDDEATNGLHNALPPARKIVCVRCGIFGISQETIEDAESLDNADRWRISAWICEYSPQLVRCGDIEQALKAPVPGLIHRANRMLKTVNKLYPHGGDFLPSQVYTKLTSVGWNRNEGHARFMLEEVLLRELGFLIERTSGTYRLTAKDPLHNSLRSVVARARAVYGVAFLANSGAIGCKKAPCSPSRSAYHSSARVMQRIPKGLLHLEGAPNSESVIGFCAMWFNPSVRFIYDDAIAPAIRAAGYEPLRIDGKEHNKRIDDEIVAAIRSARFLVADLTGHRGGVYYEAGLAHGLELEVIFTCREKRATHFDIRQYNTIYWTPDQMPDFKQRIEKRILASSIGRGPLDPGKGT